MTVVYLSTLYEIKYNGSTTIILLSVYLCTALKSYKDYFCMKHALKLLKITLRVMITLRLKKSIMTPKNESVVRIVVQFVVTLLGTLLGINL